jgi:hypothetical protein
MTTRAVSLLGRSVVRSLAVKPVVAVRWFGGSPEQEEKLLRHRYKALAEEYIKFPLLMDNSYNYDPHLDVFLVKHEIKRLEDKLVWAECKRFMIWGTCFCVYAGSFLF